MNAMSQITAADIAGNVTAAKALMLDHHNLVAENDRLRAALIAQQIQFAKMQEARSSTVMSALMGVMGTTAQGIGFWLLSTGQALGGVLVAIGVTAQLSSSTYPAWSKRLDRIATPSRIETR